MTATLHDPADCAKCEALRTGVRNGSIVCIHGWRPDGTCEVCLVARADVPTT